MLKREKGFTLIELLIVIAIVGILASVALPMYRKQTVKAKMVEVTNGMSNISSSISAYYHENEQWPMAGVTGKAAVQASFGVATGALTRLQDIAVSGGNPGGGVITGTIDGPSVDNSLNGLTLVLAPSVLGDSSITWSWDTSSTVPPAYLPKR